MSYDAVMTRILEVFDKAMTATIRWPDIPDMGDVVAAWCNNGVMYVVPKGYEKSVSCSLGFLPRSEQPTVPD